MIRLFQLTGPAITIAESVQTMQNIRSDPSKRICREQGTQAVRDFFTRGELPVEYKQVSLVCPVGIRALNHCWVSF